MQLSTKGRYAVMAMVDLAKHGDHISLPLALIAGRQNISISYLEQLFLKLRRAELVRAMRGPKGGYRLARKPADISLAAIMGAAEEPMRMNRCSEGRGQCLGGERCVTHDLWRALGAHTNEFLYDVSLQDILDGKFTGKKAQGLLKAQTDQGVLAD